MWPVRLRLAFRFVHLGRQSLGHVLVLIIIAADAPVGTGLGLHTQHCVDGRLDQLVVSGPSPLSSSCASVSASS